MTVFNIPGDNTFAFVSWPDENDIVSVIKSAQTSEPLVVGQVCNVTEKKQQHAARVRATGALIFLILQYMTLVL